jgi:hypothetical protein
MRGFLPAAAAGLHFGLAFGGEYAVVSGLGHPLEFLVALGGVLLHLLLEVADVAVDLQPALVFRLLRCLS